MTLRQSAQGEIRPLGAVLLLGAVLSGVVFNLMSRKTSGRFSALERTYVMMGVGAASFTLLAVIRSAGSWGELITPLSSPAFLEKVFRIIIRM